LESEKNLEKNLTKFNFFALIHLISLIILMSEVIANMIINPNLGYNEVSPSHLGIYQRAAVSTDANQCASVGRFIIFITFIYVYYWFQSFNLR
jgi:hypothetical protein